MEWLLLIGCLGATCDFGTTKQEFPSLDSCQKAAEWLNGTFGRRTFFSRCIGTANTYAGSKGTYGCAISVPLPNGSLTAVSIPCVAPVGSQK